MRILFLTQILPYPLDAGPKTRAYFVLRHLAAAGHDITLVSFVRPADRPEHIEHLRSFCQDLRLVPMRRSPLRDAIHLLHSVVTPTPFLIIRDQVPEMAETVEQLLDEAVRGGDAFDVVHADQLWMASYALSAARLRAGSRTPRLILDQHNAVFQIPLRLADSESNPLKRALLALEARKLVRYELDCCAKFDHVVWVTREDRSALYQPEGDDGRLHSSSVIPICVDPAAQPAITPGPAPHRVMFLGGLHWPPNAEGILWFAREVWPLVFRELPDAVLTVIGKDPPKALETPPFQAMNVEATGYVPDLIPYLEETAVFVVPLHAGGGMRVKILDAWTWGLPVVSTTIGAEGIEVRDGENMLLADSAEGFAKAVTHAFRNRELAGRLRVGGRRTVETRYNWRTTYQDWDTVYRDRTSD